MEELEKSHPQSTIEVENEYAVKLEQKEREEEKYKQLEQYENDKNKLIAKLNSITKEKVKQRQGYFTSLKNLKTYNLNIQQQEKEKYDLQQVYNSLASEIVIEKNVFTIIQKEMQEKAILLDNLNNLNTSLQNQNIENQIAQKDLLSKLEQEELKLKQEALDKQNIEREKQELLIQIKRQKKGKSKFKISI
jgi:hypothetical protein